MAAAIINWYTEGRGLFLTCNNNLSSPMTAAWFQSITSENGNSHPLLSITGTQAACTHTEASHSLAGTPRSGQSSSSHQRHDRCFLRKLWASSHAGGQERQHGKERQKLEATGGQPKFLRFCILCLLIFMARWGLHGEWHLESGACATRREQNC